MFIEECNKLLEPGHMPLETGYTQLSNGQWLVAIMTRYPNCTGEMMKWWIAEYLDSTEKYKLWDKNHIRFEWDDKKKPGEFIGASHICEEWSGGVHLKLNITFEDPAIYFDTSKFAEAGVEFAVACSIYVLGSTEVFSRLVHINRRTEYGIEQRMRIWLINGDENAAKGALEHSIEENGRMAEFLPTLYATRGNVFLRPGEKL